MTTTLDKTAIDRFAREVRIALKDLGANEVAELTEGLEADLAAQATEQGASFELADPAIYAAELREAAGLPIGGGGFFGLIDRMIDTIRDSIQRSRLLRLTSDFLHSLGPVWWIVRAYILYFLVIGRVSAYRPQGLLEWLVLFALVVASVQIGRRAWRLNKFWVRAVLVVNVVALVATPIVGIAVKNSIDYGMFLAANGAEVPQPQSGLKLNSGQVDNIFAYDENGNLLRNVQLFTQDGEPISVKFNGNEFPMVVFTDSFLNARYIENSRARVGSGWNVFPLQIETTNEDGSTTIGDAPIPLGTAPVLAPADKSSK